MKTILIKTITFRDGFSIDVSQSDVIVFVGANNSGKSESLSAVYEKIGNDSFVSPNVGAVEYEILLPNGGKDAIIAQSTYRNDTYNGTNYSIHKNYLQNWESNFRTERLGQMRPYFAELLSTEARLTLVNNPSQINTLTDAPSHPFHKVYADDGFDVKISDFTKRAFGEDFVIDRGAGSVLPAYIGERPPLHAGEDRISSSFLERLRLNPLLSKQGDGIRAFSGIAVYCLTSAKALTFIDEPETFLHPPQARILGGLMGQAVIGSGQLFVSTHSIDYINGLLSSGAKMTIVRIERGKDTSQYTKIDASTIQKISENPLIRQTNILDSFFYKHTFLCESDMDALFYSDAVAKSYARQVGRLPDVLFIHCGGKSRVPEVVGHLKALGVSPFIVLDIDALDDHRYIEKLRLALGYTGFDLKPLQKLNQRLLAVSQSITHAKILGDITSVIPNDNQPISDREIDQIKTVLKESKPWKNIKYNGVKALSKTDQSIANKVISELETHGCFILREGEIESFGKSIGKLHGPAWLEKYYLQGLTPSEARKLNTLIDRIVKVMES